MHWAGKKREEENEMVPSSRESAIKPRPNPQLSSGHDRLPVSTQEVLALQRLIGNRAVTGMLSSNTESLSSRQLGAGSQESLQPDAQKRGEDVRVHTGAEAAGITRALGAQALTVGNNIFFGRGKYDPQSASGSRLLSHELAHVAQQRSNGVTAADSTLEAEAEHAEAAPRTHELLPVSSAGGQRIQAKADPAHEEGFFHSVESALSSGFAAIGHGVASAAEFVWDGIKWLGTQLLDKITGAFSRVMQWITRLPERVGRLVMGFIRGIGTVRPWSFEWWESLIHLDTWEDFLFWVGHRVLEVLELAGVSELAETASDFIKFNTRALTSSEVNLAQSVFGKSVNLSLVRVDERAVLGPAFTERAFTSFHTINAWGGLEDSILIHELTHVWQHEKVGAVYMTEALHAQITRGLGAYDYGGTDGLRAARAKKLGLSSFNREEQAQIVQDFFLIKNKQMPWVGSGTIADLPLYVQFIKPVSTLTETQLLA
jgi:hypothetical protein